MYKPQHIITDGRSKLQHILKRKTRAGVVVTTIMATATIMVVRIMMKIMTLIMIVTFGEERVTELVAEIGCFRGICTLSISL